MISRNLLTNGGWHEKAVSHGPNEEKPSFRFSNSVQTNRGGGSADMEDEWQRHVIEGLLIAIALVIVLCGGLLWAESHGLLDSTDRTPPPAAWPTGWP
jgi:hypothetical protein